MTNLPTGKVRGDQREPERPASTGSSASKKGVLTVNAKAKKGGHLTMHVHVDKVVNNNAPGRYRQPAGS